MKQPYKIQVNGVGYTIQANPDTPLLYVLRNELNLVAPKFGCGLGQCGACMVLINGKAAPSCQRSIQSIQSAAITTLEGLAGADGSLHRVQQAFVDEQAAQCGYCMNGMIIAGVSLLNEEPQPSEAAIRKALQVNICRCGVHARVLKAIQKAANL